MHLDIKIGPYEAIKRTEYSKPRLLSTYTKEDITKKNEKLLEKIISDYERQINNPEKYFSIEKNNLVEINIDLFKDDINFLFIPNGIEKISKKAIANQLIDYIYLPNSLKEIDEHAFFRCSNLKYIHIPDSVEKIGKDTFLLCESLEYVKLSENLTTLPNSMFLSCTQLKNIILGNSIKEIGCNVFSDCIRLENITIPKSVKEIGSQAFIHCKSLKEIIIPEGVENISLELFKDCDNLESVKLPETIKYIGAGAFEGCISLKDIELSESIWEINYCAFDGTKKIENINIPRDLCKTGHGLFDNSNVKSLTFNHDLKDFDHYSFVFDLVSLSKINKLIISNNVKTISPNAFNKDGSQIKTIDYKGTKSEFEEFKKNNKKLFDLFTSLKKINFIENKEKENIKISTTER